MLRFLADESCDFAAVRALRAEGLDVLSVAEAAILLTEDKDFGQLVFAAGRESLGVVLIRFPARTRSALAARVLDLVRKHADRPAGSFVVLQPERIRLSILP